MAANKIEIIIGGQVDELVRAGQQGADALDKLGKSAFDAANDFSKATSQIGPEADRAAKSVGRLSDALNDPGSANGGIADPVLHSIQELEAELLRLQQILRKSTDPEQMKRLGAEISRLQTGINNIKTVAFQNQMNKASQSAAQAVNSLKKFTPGANEATFALVNLSRVAQDAPFGFIGIANNINPLLESFQRLRAETGSNSTALKALGNSLLGAGGLGLAIGIGSALLTVFGDKLFGIGTAAKKAKDDADELAKTIRDIGTIQAEATGGVQGQIAQVNALANAVSDSNRPYRERKRALEELKDINKAYFGDLTLEDTATGKLTKTIEEYNKALVANAVVRGFVEEIANVSKAAAIADSELAKATTKLAQAEKALNVAKATGRPTGREGTGQSLEEIRANRALIEAFKEQRNQREKLLQLETQRAVLFGRLNEAQAVALKFKDTDTKGSEKEVDHLNAQLKALEKIRDIRSNLQLERSKQGVLDLSKLRQDIDALAKVGNEIGELRIKIAERDAKKAKLPAEQIKDIVDGIKKDTAEKLNALFQREAILLESIPKIKFSQVEIAPLDTGKIESAVAKAVGVDKKIPIESDREVKIRLQGLEFVLAQEEAAKAAERLKETIVQGSVDTIAATGDAFGQALAEAFSGKGIGEGLAKAAQSLLSGIGTVVQEIGKQVIATSTAIKALKEALKTLIANPVAGIGIGISLVALGGFLKNIKIPAFADGVTNFSGGLALVGERGPELVRLPRGSDVIPNHMIGGTGAQQITVNVVGRMSGKDVVFVGQRAIQSNKTTGGGGF